MSPAVFLCPTKNNNKKKILIAPHLLWKLLYSSARRCFTLSGLVWNSKKAEAISKAHTWGNSRSIPGSWMASLSASHTHEFWAKRLHQNGGKDTDWVEKGKINQRCDKCGSFGLSLTRPHPPWRDRQCRDSRGVQPLFQGCSSFHLVVCDLYKPQSCTEDSNCAAGRPAAVRWSKWLPETSFWRKTSWVESQDDKGVFGGC